MVLSYFPLALTIDISMSATAGPWFNIKMTSYQYRKSHCGDKTIVRSSYLHNEISYTDKMSSLYWTSPQEASVPGARSRFKNISPFPMIWVCLFAFQLHIELLVEKTFLIYWNHVFFTIPYKYIPIIFHPYICVSYLYLYLYNGFCKPICITSDF